MAFFISFHGSKGGDLWKYTQLSPTGRFVDVLWVELLPQKVVTLMAYPGYGTLPETNSSHQKMLLLKQESLFPVVYFQELC